MVKSTRSLHHFLFFNRLFEWSKMAANCIRCKNFNDASESSTPRHACIDDTDDKRVCNCSPNIAAASSYDSCDNLANHRNCFQSLFDGINNSNAIDENLINSNAAEYHDISSVNSLNNATKNHNTFFLIHLIQSVYKKILTNYKNAYVV